jgi:hypothetical protein
MRRLLTLLVLIAGALVAVSSGSAFTAGTTVSCTFSPEYGTPAWSQATGAPVGTKTVCGRTTLIFDHNEQQCRGGQEYMVPVFFGIAAVDFYRGRATSGGLDSGGFYDALRANAEPAFSIVLSAHYVDDDDNMTLLGIACST